MGKVSVPLVDRQYQELLYKGQLNQLKHSPQADSPARSVSSLCRGNAVRLVKHKEVFSAGMLFQGLANVEGRPAVWGCQA